MKYLVKLEIQCDVPSPRVALEFARLAAAAAAELPSGGVVGEPRTVSGRGWRCTFEIDDLEAGGDW